MKIQTKVKNLSNASEIEALLEKKVAKLDKFLKRLHPELLVLEAAVSKNPHKALFECHLALPLPRKRLFAKKKGFTAEEAIDQAIAGLKEEYASYKSRLLPKNRSHLSKRKVEL